MEEFKYGDLVEVRDGEEPWCKAAFIAYDKDAAEYKYVARQYSCAGGYRQCRHARPGLKPGQPVVVTLCGLSSNKKCIRLFVSWGDSRGVIIAKGINSLALAYDEYALLKNYDYSSPV